MNLNDTHGVQDATLKTAAPEDTFERWWRDEGVKAIGLESAESFARRTWRAARASGVKEDGRG